jgi:uncharacterized protein (TIGR02594 family)
LPSQNAWLNKEPGPKMLIEAISHFGELEHTGPGSNPNIMAWAKEADVNGWYTDDDIPWCGLFVGIVAKRSGHPFPATKLLGARNWAQWGEAIPVNRWMLWDILVFQRSGGGHVGFYAGETQTAFLVFGGNQANSVSFSWIAKDRLVAARRPTYNIGEPANVRRIVLTQSGELSTNEA